MIKPKIEDMKDQMYLQNKLAPPSQRAKEAWLKIEKAIKPCNAKKLLDNYFMQ